MSINLGPRVVGEKSSLLSVKWWQHSFLDQKGEQIEFFLCFLQASCHGIKGIKVSVQNQREIVQCKTKSALMHIEVWNSLKKVFFSMELKVSDYRRERKIIRLSLFGRVKNKPTLLRTKKSVFASREIWFSLFLPTVTQSDKNFW